MFTLFKKTTPLALGVLLCASQACRGDEICKENTSFKKGACYKNAGSDEVICKDNPQEMAIPFKELLSKPAQSVHCGENAKQKAQEWGKTEEGLGKPYYYETRIFIKPTTKVTKNKALKDS